MSIDKNSNCEFTFKKKDYEASTSSSVSGYSSASETYTVSDFLSDFSANSSILESKSDSVYDRLNHQKFVNNSDSNYSSPIDLFVQENVYEEIDEIESYEPVKTSRLVVKNLQKEYTLNEIFESSKSLSKYAKKLENQIVFENLKFASSEPVFV